MKRQQSPPPPNAAPSGTVSTVCPTLNLCITILSRPILRLLHLETLRKVLILLVLYFIILDREEAARARPATKAFAAPECSIGRLLRAVLADDLEYAYGGAAPSRGS